MWNVKIITAYPEMFPGTLGHSVIGNALSNKKISHAELLFANLLIVFVTYGMERIWLLRHESRKNITYEMIWKLIYQMVVVTKMIVLSKYIMNM